MGNGAHTGILMHLRGRAGNLPPLFSLSVRSDNLACLAAEMRLTNRVVRQMLDSIFVVW